jgi:hypothetical protein
VAFLFETSLGSTEEDLKTPPVSFENPASLSFAVSIYFDLRAKRGTVVASLTTSQFHTVSPSILAIDSFNMSMALPQVRVVVVDSQTSL